MKNKPTKIATWFLSYLSSRENELPLIGDVEEDYKDIKREKGLFISYLWIWLQVLISIPPLTNTAITAKSNHHHSCIHFDIATTNLVSGMPTPNSMDSSARS